MKTIRPLARARRGHRMAVIASHPIQYHAPLYRELAAAGTIDLHVVYLSDAGATAHADTGFGQTISWDIPLLEGYAHTVLQPGTDIAHRRFWARHDRKLTRWLDLVSPDWILVYGYASRMNWIAVQWARRRGVRVAYASDSNMNTPRSRWVDMAKRLVVGAFFRHVDAFLSTSEANQAYLEHFGARLGDIHRIPFAIDVKRFSAGAPPPGQSRPYDFIWAGKLIDLKRPLDFIEAVGVVARTLGRPVKARIVGDGERRNDLEKAVQSLPPGCDVTFTGFVNQQAMPGVLQTADVFVFTSERDAYGLAATEAAAAGLALIVADRIGCVGNTVLARPGINSLTYPAGNVDSLATLMSGLLTNRERLEQMQQASRLISREHDLGVAAKIIEKVVMQGGA